MARRKLFISYSHLDRDWLDKLLMHIKPLERWKLIHVWSDTRISVGNSWEKEIENALIESKVAILLVSPGFLASDYIWEKEMPLIVEHRKQGMEVMPLIIKPCAWRLEKDLRPLQARPIDGRPLSTVNDAQIDLNLTDFIYELAELVEKIPGDLAAQERELTLQYRQLTGLGLPTLDKDINLSFAIPKKSIPDLVPAKWTGTYNDDLKITIEITQQNNFSFYGRIAYSGYETTTTIEGRIVGDRQDVNNDALRTASKNNDSAKEEIAILFEETGYERIGTKSVDFNGEYRASITDNMMIGSWTSYGNYTGYFKLYSDDFKESELT